MTKITIKHLHSLVHKPSVPALLNLFRPNKAKIAVAMFHTGRCGSTVLSRMLNQHPEIEWASEILTKVARDSKEKFQDEEVLSKEVYSREKNAIRKVFGFETKFHTYQQLDTSHLNLQLEEYIQKLNENNFSKFIHLERKNTLRKIISGLIGMKTRVWHKKADNKKSDLIRVTLNVNSFNTYSYRGTLKDFIKNSIDENSRCRDLLQAKDHLFLNYEEDILQDPRVAYQKVIDFLEITPFVPEITLRRTNSRLLSEVIENYAEVEEYLRPTKYYWMLADL